MKLDKAILSSNDNPDYLEFWPIVSEAWKNIGIEPVLFYTGKNKIKKENVYNFNLEKCDTAFLAQNIRLLAPTLFPNETCIISDIDNMPLSREYFQNPISEINDSHFVIYRPDAVPKNMISIMWNVAKGSTWSEIFKITTVRKIKLTLIYWYIYFYKLQRYNWYTDQILLKKYISKFQESNIERIVELDDKKTNFNRLDRESLDEGLDNLILKKVYFSDFHMPRPFSKYDKQICDVYDKVFKNT